MFKLSRRSPALVVAAVAVIAVGGAAFASIPESGGVVHACYQKKGGVLRVVDTAKHGFAGKCRASETRLSWSQKGPQGLPGSQGIQGVTGPQGAKGDQGAPGPFPGVLPRGLTIRGTYYETGVLDGTHVGVASEGISFGFTLASAPTAQVIYFGESPTAQCPGSAAAPQASPGYLCAYEADSKAKREATYPHIFGVTPFGAAIYTQGASASPGEIFWSRGSWAVSSP